MASHLIPAHIIHRQIVSVRGHRIILDSTLAKMYGVEVRALNQAVKRNQRRFPADFAFRLTADEVADLKSQSVISNRSTHGGARRAMPMAFTEQGVAMLSGVLSSPRAVAVNIAIMRAFVGMRQLLAMNADLAHKLDALETKYDQQFRVVFDAIRQMMAEPDDPEPEPEPMGFKVTGG